MKSISTELCKKEICQCSDCYIHKVNIPVECALKATDDMHEGVWQHLQNQFTKEPGLWVRVSVIWLTFINWNILLWDWDHGENRWYIEKGQQWSALQIELEAVVHVWTYLDNVVQPLALSGIYPRLDLQGCEHCC